MTNSPAKYCLSIVAFVFLSAGDFAETVTDLWYGFGDVTFEFGWLVEQLPV